MLQPRPPRITPGLDLIVFGRGPVIEMLAWRCRRRTRRRRFLPVAGLRSSISAKQFQAMAGSMWVRHLPARLISVAGHSAPKRSADSLIVMPWK